MRFLPGILIGMRLLLAPVLIVIASQYPEHQSWIAWICLTALVADIFDGIIARHYGVATAKLRLWDSNVDLVFWICACIGIYLCYSEEIHGRMYLVGCLLLLEWVPDMIYLVRFREFGCAHNYLSKLFGIFLLLNIVFLFVFHATFLLTATVIVGILSQLDRIGIALIMHERQCDVPSAYHARKIAKGLPVKKYKIFHG